MESHKVFDEYHELFGEKFPLEHEWGKWRSLGRARLFRARAKSVLPGWELQDEGKDSGELYFKRSSPESSITPRFN